MQLPVEKQQQIVITPKKERGITFVLHLVGAFIFFGFLLSGLTVPYGLDEHYVWRQNPEAVLSMKKWVQLISFTALAYIVYSVLVTWMYKRKFVLVTLSALFIVNVAMFILTFGHH